MASTTDQRKMDRFRSCPICTEELLKEIYQCSEGHVICNLCVSKVSQCPQCRAPFGKKKIRNRALEEVLDLEEFECKFKENGCKYSCKRDKIDSHIKSCSFNTEVPLCELLTGKDDMFKVSSASKEDVISHFKNQHNCFERSIADDAWFVAESGGFLRSIIERKAGAPSTPSNFLRLFSRQVPELSPLFLIHGNVNHKEGLLSVGCVKISNSKFNTGVQYGIEFQITRIGSPISPFPIGGSVIVISVSQAPQMLKVAKVTFPIEMLKDIGFGMKMGDSLAAKIVHVTN